MVETGVSLGSNLSDRLGALKEARNRIAALPRTRCVALSPVYETEPVGVKPEHAHLLFLNAVLICETDIPLLEWLSYLHAIEQDLGRQRNADRYAPRVIDIDLLYYGAEQRAEDDLFVPHKYWNTRRFVVQPLADVRPDLVLPGESRAVKEILESLPTRPAVKLLTNDW